MKIVPIPSRLGFVVAARSALDFVTEPPYSMWLTGQDEGRVEYEGEDVTLLLLHDRMSYELDIAVWRPSVEDEVRHPFTIADMIRVVDPAKARAYRRYSASNEESVRRGVAELVSDFRRYGLTALTGRADFYQEMSAARSDAARQFGSELADKASRKRAERAWQERDYQGVVEAYRSMKGHLSGVERERLHYALQKSGN
jgi:hypothetical protein